MEQKTSELFASILESIARRSPWHGWTNRPGENIFEFPLGSTTFRFHAEGLGDLMIVRQFGKALHQYAKNYGDPGLGLVVIACGGWEPAFNPTEGDINLFWWWSMGKYDDSPERFLESYEEEVTVKPEVVLCLSEKCQQEASELGYETILLPLGSQSYEPLSLDRSGIGYAGSKGHKQSEKVQQILGPFINRPDFEWVDSYVYPTQLNMWYNSKELTFGLTKEGQRQWGMVNNRVYETLASGTPLLLETHPAVEDRLGFEYPYQASSQEEAEKIASDLTEDREIRSEFVEYSERVQSEHSYNERVSTLMNSLT